VKDNNIEEEEGEKYLYYVIDILFVIFCGAIVHKQKA
jgi:hypothetical protein